MPLVSHVNQERLGQADEIHTAMLEEAPVLDGHHGIDHHFRDVIVPNQLPLGSLLGVEQGRHQLRLQFVGREQTAAAADGINLAVRDQDPGRIRAVVRLRTRRDLDSAG